MEKKRIYQEDTPPGNIPYCGPNGKFRFNYIVPADDSIILEKDRNGVLYISAPGSGGGTLPEAQDFLNGFVVLGADGKQHHLSAEEFLINLLGLTQWLTLKDKTANIYNEVCDIETVVEQCALRGWPVLNIVTHLQGYTEGQDMVIEYKLTDSVQTGQPVTDFLDLTPLCYIQNYGDRGRFDPIGTSVISTTGPDSKGEYTVKLRLTFSPDYAEASTSIADFEAAEENFLVQVVLQKQITGQDEPTTMTQKAQGQYLFSLNQVVDEIIDTID